MKALIDRLAGGEILALEQWQALFAQRSPQDENYARNLAREICQQHYGRKVYLRGLVEISSICKNDCYYCGLRRSNAQCQRYRLTPEEIFESCREGHALGLRTFVLQGGEDAWFTDARLCEIIRQIRRAFPDSAITLSLGERSRESYQELFDAGANRYLLRHETADETHYGQLHPPELSLSHRMDCLRALKDVGYQVGAGFMVGSPHQTARTLAKDMAFLQEFRPHMAGIGPFLPHHATPFRDEPAGGLQDTLFCVALTRLALPEALIPATTALATLEVSGRDAALLGGANVIMPNLSPAGVRKKYLLYDNKRAFGSEAAESLRLIHRALAQIGREMSLSRGDHISIAAKEERT